MPKKTYTFTIEEEISEDLDKIRTAIIPQLSRSQFVETALLEKMEKEKRKQSKQ